MCDLDYSNVDGLSRISHIRGVKIPDVMVRSSEAELHVNIVFIYSFQSPCWGHENFLCRGRPAVPCKHAGGAPTRGARRQLCSCCASCHVIIEGGSALWAGRSLRAATSLQAPQYVDGAYRCLQTWSRSIQGYETGFLKYTAAFERLQIWSIASVFSACFIMSSTLKGY